MPAMDAFRQRWPEVELDIVSGFHPDPIALVMQDRAEVAIVSEEDPDDMLDIIRQVLGPAVVEPAQRRTTALAVGMLQLVASGRGIATLPLWAVQNDLDRGDVTARAIGARGLTGRLYMACTPSTSEQPWLADCVQITRETCFESLPAIALL